MLVSFCLSVKGAIRGEMEVIHSVSLSYTEEEAQEAQNLLNHRCTQHNMQELLRLV